MGGTLQTQALPMVTLTGFLAKENIGFFTNNNDIFGFLVKENIGFLVITMIYYRT